MDRSLCFVAAVAFSCAGLPPAFGQIQLLSSAPSTTQLVARSTGDGVPEVAGDQGAIANPFDIFPSGPVELSESDDPAQSVISGERPVATTAAPNTSPSASDPAALNTGRSVLQTIHDQAMISQLPHAAYAPVQWSSAAQTPNPIAQILLREDCHVDALWAGYPVQRAAECAHMWSHINRHQTCNNCGVGHCGQGACGQSGCASCGRAPVRNRYLAAAPVATGCASCATCDAATGVSAPAVPTLAPMPEIAPHYQSAPAVPAAPAATFGTDPGAAWEPGLIEDKVATLPTLQR